MESFAKTYGVWLVVAVILFLIAVGGWLYWQNRQRAQSAKRSEQLSSIFTDIGAGKSKQAQKRLQPLESADNETVRALALLTDAAVALDGNDRTTALSKYRILAGDDKVAEPFRDVALIRSTSLEFDSIKPEQVIARLAPLTKPGSPWFGSAGELTAMAYLKQGQKDKAGRLFAAIAADKTVPETLRNRAVQIAGTLGVDASANAPQTAQPGFTQ